MDAEDSRLTVVEYDALESLIERTIDKINQDPDNIVVRDLFGSIGTLRATYESILRKVRHGRARAQAIRNSHEVAMPSSVFPETRADRGRARRCHETGE